MSDPLFIERGGHRTWLKWHRARRRASDPVFTGARILEAMRLGASVEVDLVVTADGGFAVLHDHVLDRETTGTGRVDAAHDTDIRTLKLRGNTGEPLPDSVMLLDDLCRLARANPIAEGALLQLDLKEEAAALDETAIRRFAEAVTPLADNIILSSGDAPAVEYLRRAVPAMSTGFDASDKARVDEALAAGNVDGFVDWAVAAAPNASIIYLYWEIVTRFADSGLDIIAAFHRHHRRIDAWTIRQVDAEALSQVERLLSLHADQITTDDPEGLYAALTS